MIGGHISGGCQVAPDDPNRKVAEPEMGQARPTNIGAREKFEKEGGSTEEFSHLPGQVTSAIQSILGDGKAQGTATKAKISVPRISKTEWLHIFETTGLCRVRGISTIF